MQLKDYLNNNAGKTGGNCAEASLTSGEDRRSTFAGLLVAVVAFLVYANSLGNGFVWDDSNIILTNPELRGDPFSLFGGIDTARDLEPTPYYRPLTLLTFLIEERLHGLTALPMHLVNVLLHAANAFLVYRLARSLNQDSYAAFFAGLLFAVHPINSEAVNFISGGRNTMLSGLFVLITYLLHRRSIREKKVSGALAGAFFFLAGLFSKETALAVLPFIVALEIPSLRSGVPGLRVKAVWKLTAYVACAVVYFAMRMIALSGAGVKIDVLPGLGVRLLDNLYIIPKYLLTVIWPPSLSMKYVVPDDLHLLTLPLIVSWVCIIGCLGWLLSRRRTRATLFGLFWMVTFWLPVSGIIPFPSAALADRYIYISAVGLWIVFADQTVRLKSLWNEKKRYAFFAAGLVLLLLASLTVKRNLDWESDVSLFSRYVEQYPDIAGGHHNLGCAYLDKVGDLDAAEREFEKAFALDPYFPRLRTQMGYIQLLRGDYEGALRHYNEAISQNPFDAEAHLNRATSFDKLGRYEAAVADYKYFLAIPGNELAGARSRAAERVRALSQ